MLRKNLSIFVVLLTFFNLNSQYITTFGQTPPKWKLKELYVIKTGPYFGLQIGKYTNFEIGIERQWKKIQLKTTKTHAINLGFQYDYKQRVLGYNMGYWIKPSRVGLTYGANLAFRTDFDVNRFGIVPVVGYKLYGFHLQTGYHFLSRSENFVNTNTYFISLRFTLVNNRKLDTRD